MTAERSITISVSHHFSASSERVYDAWLDPKSLGNWLFTTPQGKIVRCEVDARVGGRFVVVDRRDGVDVEHVGVYVELERPSRIAFMLSVPMYSARSDRVLVQIEREGSGCVLTLTQDLDPKLAERSTMIERGWGEIVAALDASLR